MRRVLAAAALAAALSGCRASTAKLADGVWAISVGGVANYGVVRGEFGTVVVDSGPGPVAGDELVKLAERITVCEVTYVVNTSADPRRALGNQSFEHAEIIAHELVGEELRDRGEAMLRRLKEHPKAKALGAGVCELPLAKGDEAVLTENPRVAPVVTTLPSSVANPWGIKN